MGRKKKIIEEQVDDIELFVEEDDDDIDNINISTEITSYRNNPLLKKAGIKIEFTPAQVEEYLKCAQDPIYFIKKYIKIVHIDHGVIPFELWPFQENMINVIHNNRRVIGRVGRQSGKSTTTIAYLLWLSLFSDHQNIAILANKGTLSRELLSRYQMAYENLPLWLQQGIVVWNKGSLELENGSKIIAAATSSSAIRGGSFSCVVLDEFAHVHNNLAEDFFTSVYPVISSGKKSKIIIISTPKGMNLFYKLFTDAKAGRSDYAVIDVHWSEIPGRTPEWAAETIKNTSQRQFNQEFGCDFLGSTNTLVDVVKLQCLSFKNTIQNIFDMEVFELPIKQTLDELGNIEEKEHLYFITVDVSEGKNLDYSAFNVIDCSTIPYRQVARYRSNTISPILFPTIIKNCAEYYNNAYVLIEINNNPQIAEFLHNDLEYENILKVISGNKKAQQVSTGGKGQQLGLKMSSQVKRIGCSNLKTLIEHDKIVINDFETVSELTTFIGDGVSFSAEEGCNDDIVMSLVMFGWLSTQRYFTEIVTLDLRKQLQSENFESFEQETLPIGEFNNGEDLNYFVEEGDMWFDSRIEDPFGSFISRFM